MNDYESTLIELSRMQRAAWLAAFRRARGTYDERKESRHDH